MGHPPTRARGRARGAALAGRDEPTTRDRTRLPTTRLRIDGHLDEHWSAWFGGLTLIREDDGTTTLRGAVIDQAELHGLLTKLRDLGITLISLASIESVPDTDQE